MAIDYLQRSELLYGAEGMRQLARTRVILFGVGGVGSWCAEALVRTGIGHLTMVDADEVDPTNINRQLPATTATIGRPKADVLAQRLREIRPECEIEAVQAFYTADNAAVFAIEDYNVCIDAIDSLGSKAALILQSTSVPGLGFYSSMGAARRVDPGQVRDAEFWHVRGCPLARALRDRFKKTGELPRRKFRCVYSEEAVCGEPKGTSMMVTATFGLRLAALAVNGILKRQ